MREEERELMKDHPGWVVGTLYGEPLYSTIDPNEMPDLAPISYYTHRPFATSYEWCYPDAWL